MTARLKSYINDILKPAYGLTSNYEVLEGNPIWIVPVEGRSELSYLLRNADFKKIAEQIFGPISKIDYYDEAIHISLPELIEGPLSVSEHRSTKYNKRIVVFGEQHVHKQGCGGKKISQFLQEVVSSHPNKQFDLFLEIPYLTQETEFPKEATDDIERILLAFRNCFRYTKGNCEYPNLRAHYTDMRIANQLTDLSRLVERIVQDSDNTKAWEEVVRIFKGTKDPLQYIIDQADIQGKLAKQLREADPEVVQSLLNYYRQRISDLPKFITEVEEYISVLKRGYVNHGTSRKLGKQLIIIYSIVLDLYLLGRIFRKFQDADSPTNILIYVGDAHAEAIRGFLTQLGFEKIHEVQSENDCVDVSEFGGFFD